MFVVTGHDVTPVPLHCSQYFFYSKACAVLKSAENGAILNYAARVWRYTGEVEAQMCLTTVAVWLVHMDLERDQHRHNG